MKNLRKLDRKKLKNIYGGKLASTGECGDSCGPERMCSSSCSGGCQNGTCGPVK